MSKNYEFEEWKPIEGYENYLAVSNYGRIKQYERIVNSGNGAKRIIRERILDKVYKGSNGYSYVCPRINGDNFTLWIHLSVAQAFIPNRWKLPQINHKDENKENNCVWNLEWCTRLYNTNYGTRNERISEKMKQIKGKPIRQYTLDGQFIAEYDSLVDASKETGILKTSICNCLKGRSKNSGGFLWQAA